MLKLVHDAEASNENTTGAAVVRCAPHLVAFVRAGVKFERGRLVERPDGSGGDQQVA